MTSHNIFWFRRDLRLLDNTALDAALSDGKPLAAIFIFDKNILDELPPDDKRVLFIHNVLKEIDNKLRAYGGKLHTFYGNPVDVWKRIIEDYDIDTVFYNRDYEPYAVRRDQEVSELLEQNNIKYKSYKDHVIFQGDEVLKADGTPYTVFTPYKNKWLEKFQSELPNLIKEKVGVESLQDFIKLNDDEIMSLPSMGFDADEYEFPIKEVPQNIIKKYSENRDFPSVAGTSKLGIHFRFGTISIREKALRAYKLNMTYLSELIWRDFYSMILFHFPQVVTSAFRPQYDDIKWVNNKSDFENWKNGKTGYPLVDAGMRQLNETGFMHNRVRMVVASFLTKHLLIDWRWGEAYFAEKLLDFELASNNGGWQWAAGSGTDAAPYFRIFNPALQLKKFDKDLEYVKKWVPEYGTSEYPSPIVDHSFARNRCLETYKSALNKA